MDSPTQQELTASSASTAIDSEVARELANMSQLIRDSSEALDRELEDIKRPTFAVENKVMEISEHLN